MSDLGAAASLLHWDQETYMPPPGTSRTFEDEFVTSVREGESPDGRIANHPFVSTFDAHQLMQSPGSAIALEISGGSD